MANLNKIQEAITSSSLFFSNFEKNQEIKAQIGQIIWQGQQGRVNQTLVGANGETVSYGGAGGVSPVLLTKQRPIIVNYDEMCSVELKDCDIDCDGILDAIPINTNQFRVDIPSCLSATQAFEISDGDFLDGEWYSSFGEKVAKGLYKSIQALDEEVSRLGLEKISALSGQSYADAPLPAGIEYDPITNCHFINPVLIGAPDGDAAICLEQMMMDNDLATGTQLLDSNVFYKDFRKSQLHNGLPVVEGRNNSVWANLGYNRIGREMNRHGYNNKSIMIEPGAAYYVWKTTYAPSQSMVKLGDKELYRGTVESISYPGMYYDFIYQMKCKDGKTNVHCWALEAYVDILERPNYCNTKNSGVFKFEIGTCRTFADPCAEGCEDVVVTPKSATEGVNEFTIPANVIEVADALNGGVVADAINDLQACVRYQTASGKIVATITDPVELATDTVIPNLVSGTYVIEYTGTAVFGVLECPFREEVKVCVNNCEDALPPIEGDLNK